VSFIVEPIFDTTLATHSARKSGRRSGEDSPVILQCRCPRKFSAIENEFPYIHDEPKSGLTSSVSVDSETHIFQNSETVHLASTKVSVSSRSGATQQVFRADSAGGNAAP
jgi:hypothetical protein